MLFWGWEGWQDLAGKKTASNTFLSWPLDEKDWSFLWMVTISLWLRLSGPSIQKACANIASTLTSLRMWAHKRRETKLSNERCHSDKEVNMGSVSCPRFCKAVPQNMRCLMVHGWHLAWAHVAASKKTDCYFLPRLFSLTRGLHRRLAVQSRSA